MTLDDAATQQALSGVLSDAPFTTPTGSEALLAFLRRWFSESGDLYVERPVVFWLTIVGLLVVLALLLWHIVYSLRTTWRAVRRSGRSVIHRSSEAPLDFSAAHQALAAANYRVAIEQSFALVQRVLASHVDKITPRALLHRVRGELSSDEVGMLERLVEVHEAACYAENDVSADTAREALGVARFFVMRA